MTHQYLVVYVKGRGEGQGFMGYSPDVPGCVSTGDTLDEMRQSMQEALAFHIEGILEDGGSAPEPHETTVNFARENAGEVERYIVEWLPVTLPALELSALHHATPAPATHAA